MFLFLWLIPQRLVKPHRVWRYLSLHTAGKNRRAPISGGRRLLSFSSHEEHARAFDAVDTLLPLSDVDYISVDLVLVVVVNHPSSSSGGGSSGGGNKQLVTVAEASRMLAPLVAQEVEKEAKKIEIRMQVRVFAGFAARV